MLWEWLLREWRPFLRKEVREYAEKRKHAEEKSE